MTKKKTTKQPVHSAASMTIREYFAGAALQAILTKGIDAPIDEYADAANEAVQFADALIARLEGTE